MRRLILVFATFLMTTSLWAQAPAAGERELTGWVAGGHSVSGGTSGVGLFNAGLRYGWVLAGPLGPGFLRGSLEYAVDAIPLYLVFQNGGTYGAGLDPFAVKWNFVNARRVVPFIELAGGVLFTKSEMPRGTSNVNFVSQAAFGVHLTGHRFNPTFAVRYAHISNAGLTVPNPGINTVQFQLGLSSFRKRK